MHDYFFHAPNFIMHYSLFKQLFFPDPFNLLGTETCLLWFFPLRTFELLMACPECTSRVVAGWKTYCASCAFFTLLPTDWWIDLKMPQAVLKSLAGIGLGLALVRSEAHWVKLVLMPSVLKHHYYLLFLVTCPKSAGSHTSAALDHMVWKTVSTKIHLICLCFFSTGI